MKFIRGKGKFIRGKEKKKKKGKGKEKLSRNRNRNNLVIIIAVWRYLIIRERVNKLQAVAIHRKRDRTIILMRSQ